MAKLYNLARMSTATTGTGIITLGSAVSGFLSFAGAGASDGDVVSYAIADGTNSEIGTGTYTASGTTLSRTVTKSTNSNSAISLSGSAQVFITPRAEDLTITTEAQAEAGTNNTAVMTPQATAQAIVAIAQKFKNVVGRNGGLEVWQRLTTGTTITLSASAVAYTVDGWYLATGANQASTITRVAGLTSGSSFAAQIQRNSGQTGTGAMVFALPLDTDELAKLRGNAAVLSFTVATGANWSPTSGTLTWKLYCGTGSVAKRNGTAYTSESNPISGSVNLSTSSAAARQVSAISSAIGSTITQAELQFTWTPSGTAGVNDWFSIDDVQVEIVPTGIVAVVPLFERSDYIWDLLRCQRFLPVFKNQGGTLDPYGIGQANSTSSAAMIFPFPVVARVAPTGIVISAAADFSLTNSTGTGTALNALTFVGASINCGWIQGATATTPFTAGNASQFFSTTGTALISFTGAEI